MSRPGLFLTVSTIGLLLSAGASLAAPGSALPTGGSVMAGSAAISNSGASTTISQSTPKAIIDWQGFSIGKGGSVQFDNGSGATLNRVTGTSGSAIDGLLSGTGSVYLINPNGVIVGKTGEVKVGGSFVASTLDLPDASFLSGGNLTFSGPSMAAVVDAGKVGSLGGDVVLIAATVSNSGSISASKGSVGLLAGQSVLLRDQALDDGKFSVLVGGSGTSATNSGLIEAANAELRANGGNVYALAGNTAGVIRATGANAGDGHVRLTADGGSLDVAGTITARGPKGSGGAIETSGTDVKIGASSIDAGVGGTWLVDPYDLTVDSSAAASISGALNAGTNVTEQTTASGASGYGNQNPSGNGDIFVQAPISWSTGATLTLDAYRNLVITAPITASGAGQAVLLTGSGGSGHLDFGLGQSGFAGSLSFTGAEGGGQSLTINGTPYTLIYSMAELAALNGTSTNAAPATDLNATTTYTDAVVKTFGGNLEGLGHVVQNLTIDAPADGTGAGYNIGLVGQLGASSGSTTSISDLGVAGGNVSGEKYVGGLVGWNYGVIDRTFVSADVNETSSVSQSAVETGDLVGLNYGSISWSHATGNVDGSSTAHPARASDLGGLVGRQSGGSIDHSYYAEGMVSGSGVFIDVGGLVGSLAGGSVVESYAAGQVSGSQWIGGLVGQMTGGSVADSFSSGTVDGIYSGGFAGSVSGGSITDSYSTSWLIRGGGGGLFGGFGNATASNVYWDTQTSGRTKAVFLGSSPSGVTGLTTAQLQASLPAGFDSTVWGQIPGVSFPYLKDFYPTTPQVISGLVQNSPGAIVAGNTVVATVNGSMVIGSSVAGADGEYYFIEPAGTLPAGSTVVLYIPYASASAAASTAVEKIAAGASVTGANLRQQWATIITPDTSLSAAANDLSAGLGPATSGPDAAIVFGVSGGALTLTPNTSLQLFPTGASFDFDQSLRLNSNFLIVNASGAVTQSFGGITTQLLQGSSVGGLSLTNTGNRIVEFDGWTDPSGAISLTDGEGLSINGPVNATGASFTTTAGDLQVSNAVRVGTGGVVLNSAGRVIESGARGYISSQSSISATAVGGVTMNGTNVSLGTALTNTGGGAIRYTSYGNLNLTGASNAGAGTIVLAANKTTGGAGTINIKGPVNGGTVTLTSPFGITETGSGAITATLLNGSAAGAVTLGGANMIGKLSSFSDTAGDFSLTDGQALQQIGTFDGTGRTVKLTTTVGGIQLTGTLDAATANLNAATTLKETGSGLINATNLQGSAGGAVTLNGSNMIGNITGFTDTGGDFILNDGQALTLTGTFDGTGRAITLTATSGKIAVNGTVKAATLSLTSVAADLTESTSTGSIIAGTLNAAANTGITLTSSTNQITTIGTDHTNSGPNNIQQ